jgi:hypothetical protein
MEIGESLEMKIYKYGGQSWVGTWKRKILTCLGFSESEVKGELAENGKIKPLALKLTACKDADGKAYLRIDRSEPKPVAALVEAKLE